jgi:hypothetical protein
MQVRDELKPSDLRGDSQVCGGNGAAAGAISAIRGRCFVRERERRRYERRMRSGDTTPTRAEPSGRRSSVCVALADRDEKAAARFAAR